VDAHNHVAYNVLPRWQPPKLYKNWGQWQGSDAYKISKKPYDGLALSTEVSCE
jgi:5-methylthioadenosine/S-adenosylhomocysteine deaminase